MRESEPKYTPEITSNNRVSNLTPEADSFFTEAIKYGGFSRLNFRTARIIDTYIGTNATYADLAKIAGVTRARIGQIIGKGVERLLLALPDEVRKQFQNQEPLIIKSGFSPETRAKMSEARKGYWKNKKVVEGQ